VTRPPFGAQEPARDVWPDFGIDDLEFVRYVAARASEAARAQRRRT
jgi:hypothetical protein